MTQEKVLPFEIVNVKAEETESLNRHLQGGVLGEYGPKGYFLPSGFEKEAAKIVNLEIRSDDVWVLTYPKSGTTWVQELVWMVANGGDYATAKSMPLALRFPFLEMKMFFNNARGLAYLEELRDSGDERKNRLADELSRSDTISQNPSPRFIKSHLPLSLLPPSLLDTCKVIHMARDPRDVAASYYNHYKLFTMLNFSGEFKEFWNFFLKDQLIWSPFFENVKESWEMRHHPNMLFLFYEDLLKDLPSAVRRVADFLGKTITEEQMGPLCEHLSFDSFKKNKCVNAECLKDFGVTAKTLSFLRKGTSGGWRDQFDEEMTAQATEWMTEHLRGTDLTFPES